MSESQNQDNRKSVLNFGEDYAEFLTNSSESSDFSENEVFYTKYDQRKLQRQVRLKNVKLNISSKMFNNFCLGGIF